VNFILCNLGTKEDVDKFSKDKGLSGASMHGFTGGQPAPEEFKMAYLPHKAIVGKDGKVLANFNLPGGKLQTALDGFLAEGTSDKKAD